MYLSQRIKGNIHDRITQNFNGYAAEANPYENGGMLA
jgi:hypothetical protein